MKIRFHISILMTAIIILFFINSRLLAVPVSKEVWEQLKAEGRIDGFIAQMKDAQSRGVDSPEPIKTKTNFALGEKTIDTVRVLVLLVDFPDKPADPKNTAAAFDSVLFSEGRKNPTGSLTEYYLENSYGTFHVIGDVYGWFRMDSSYSYYSPDSTHGLGTYPHNTQRLTLDAIAAADSAGVDFSLYDSYGNGGFADGQVDGVFIVHSGAGFEESSLAGDIHSHKWNLGSTLKVFIDGVTIDPFTVEPEKKPGPSGKISPIGVFCHEYGHFIGLPDLYDINDPEGARSTGLGQWSLMATGSYNGASKSPAHLDAWCKIAVGFAIATPVYSNMTDVHIPQVETSPIIYKLWAAGDYSGHQYFLLENRQKTKFDYYLPGQGLLIYHIKDIPGGSNAGLPYHVALEQADGLSQLENTGSEGDTGDPWPGSTKNRFFDDLSIPNSKAYGPEITEVSVWNISDPDSVMTANLDIRWSRPHFALLDSSRFSDQDNDGVFEPGEKIQYFFFLRNDWKEANNVIIRMTCDNSAIKFNVDSVFKSFMAGDGEETNNLDRPIEFVIPTDLIPTFDSFYVSVESDGAHRASFGLERQIGQSRVLIVDDDRSGGTGNPNRDWMGFYSGDLYKRRIPADSFDCHAFGSSPPGPLLSSYSTVIWFTGDSASDYLTPDDVTAIKYFLDHGGNLFLTGQGIATDLHYQDSAFLENYLHSRWEGKHFWFEHIGVKGSPIGANLRPGYVGGTNVAMKVPAHLLPINGGFPIFQYGDETDSLYASAVGFSGSNKVVFFDWGYEAIYIVRYIDPINHIDTTFSRDTVLAAIMKFFGDVATDVEEGGQISVLPKSFELGQNYPNPFNPTTTIKYSLRNISGQAIPNTTLKIYNILGQEIRKLVDRRELPGEYTIEWDGADSFGNRVASGIYFYRLTRGQDQETRKMVLLK